MPYPGDDHPSQSGPRHSGAQEGSRPQDGAVPRRLKPLPAMMAQAPPEEGSQDGGLTGPSATGWRALWRAAIRQVFRHPALRTIFPDTLRDALNLPGALKGTAIYRAGTKLRSALPGEDGQRSPTLFPESSGGALRRLVGEGLPAFFDVRRLLGEWHRTPTTVHAIVAGSVVAAVAGLTFAFFAVDQAGRAIAQWRRTAAATEVTLPALVRRVPDPARLLALRSALLAAYPGVEMKVQGSEVQLFVTSADRIAAWRGAAQRLPALDPGIRWEVALLCAGGGPGGANKECQQSLYLSLTAAIADFELKNSSPRKGN